MKKVILIYGLTLALIAGVFYACKKENPVLPNSNPAPSNVVTAQSQNSDLETPGGGLDKEKMHDIRMRLLKMPLHQQRKMFSDLSTTEKFGVWRDKWDQVMTINWSVQQKQHLEKVNDILSLELFIDNSKEINFFSNHFQKPWREKAEKLFNQAVLIQIADRIADVDPTINEIPYIGDPIECPCSTDDDWCYRSNCTKGRCYISSSRGCSWWWRYGCNGDCIR